MNGSDRSPTNGVRALRIYLSTLVLLGPLKFGSVIAPGEMGVFPESGWDLVFSSWPTTLLPILAALGLLWALLLRVPMPPRDRGWFMPGVWLLLVPAGLAGLIRTTEWDHATVILPYFCGIGCFVVTVYMLLPYDPALRRWLLAALGAGTLLCCLSGWRQVPFGGLQQTAEHAARMAREQGLQLPGALWGRLEQRWAFGTFVYPNSYAAHLILTGPLMLLLLWRCGRYFQPVRISQPLFFSLGLVLLLGALKFSGSRAGIAGAAVGLSTATFLHPKARRWRWLMLVGCLILCSLAFATTLQRKGLLSVSVRVHYYTAAVRMFASRPLTGVGLGEFFPYYMRLKPPGVEETRVAHNMLLGLAAETGILGVVAAGLCLLMPLLAVLSLSKERLSSDNLLRTSVLAGVLSWATHAMLDFNFQIPGSTIIAAFMPQLFLVLDQRPPQWERGHGRIPIRALLLLLALAAASVVWRLPGQFSYRGLYERHRRRHQESLARFRDDAERTAELLPLSPYPHLLLGRVAEYHGSPVLAIRSYAKASARAPHRSSFNTHIATNHLLLGDPQSARAALSKASEWYPYNSRNLALHGLLRLVESWPRERWPEIQVGAFALLNSLSDPKIEDGRLVIECHNRFQPSLDPVLERICNLLNEEPVDAGGGYGRVFFAFFPAPRPESSAPAAPMRDGGAFIPRGQQD